MRSLKAVVLLIAGSAFFPALTGPKPDAGVGAAAGSA